MAIAKSSNDEEELTASFEYKPHPAQITALILLLNMADKNGFGDLRNAMAQI